LAVGTMVNEAVMAAALATEQFRALRPVVEDVMAHEDGVVKMIDQLVERVAPGLV